MRYASSPLPRPPRQRRSLPGFSGPSSGSSSKSRQSTRRASASRGATSHRASAALGLSARARAGARSHRSSHGRQPTRGQGLTSVSARRSRRQGIPQAGMGIFGQNESELESGTVGGVRAAGSESDDDTASGSNADSSTGTAPASSPYRGLPRGIAAYDEDEREGWTAHDAADPDGSDEEDSDRFWLIESAVPTRAHLSPATRAVGAAKPTLSVVVDDSAMIRTLAPTLPPEPMRLAAMPKSPRRD